jgi:hypothetical protein
MDSERDRVTGGGFRECTSFAEILSLSGLTITAL